MTKVKKTTKRFILIVFCIYFARNIAFMSSLPPILQDITSSVVNHPIIHTIHNQWENIKYIPIENKLNFMYTTYSIRKLFYNLVLSQDVIIKLLEHLEWHEIDYFNAMVYIGALYTLLKDLEMKPNIKKLKENGIITKPKIHKFQLIFLVMFTILFRDVEYAF